MNVNESRQGIVPGSRIPLYCEAMRDRPLQLPWLVHMPYPENAIKAYSRSFTSSRSPMRDAVLVLQLCRKREKRKPPVGNFRFP